MLYTQYEAPRAVEALPARKWWADKVAVAISFATDDGEGPGSRNAPRPIIFAKGDDIEQLRVRDVDVCDQCRDSIEGKPRSDGRWQYVAALFPHLRVSRTTTHD